MLVAGLTATVFGTNCYVLADGPGSECLVVDPGVGTVEGLDELLAQHRLRPVAVLLTHGHLDHTFSVTPVCGARGIPAYVHTDDADRLVDPLPYLGPQLLAAVGGHLDWAEPDDVRTMTDGTVLDLAGLRLTVDAAPGHTEGSVLFRSADGGPDGAPLALTGDVLFAGAVGRTDLPGGDEAAMRRSLEEKVLTLDDATHVLPGHGDPTTVGAERRTNPFLRRLQRDAS